MIGTTGLGAAALVFYLAAEALSILRLRSDRESYGTAASLTLFLGFLVHFAALSIGAKATHTVPYNDLPGSMSLYAWMLAASYGILVLRHREGSTGPFLIPLSILFLGASLLTRSHVMTSDPRFLGPVFAWHVTMAILGYAAFTLSFVLANLYLIQTRQLHRRRQGILFLRLPALDVLSRLHRTSVATGVLALSTATCLGLFWAKQNWGHYWDFKVAFTFLVLAIYATTLLSPWTGWSQKKNAYLSISGFVLLMFSYTIVNLFISHGHLFR